MYNIASYRFDRFSAYAGFTSLEALKNEVIFSVYVDNTRAAEVSCKADTKTYNWNGTKEITRNFCSYIYPLCKEEDLPMAETCKEPFQPFDVLLPANAKTLELRATLPSSLEKVCDGDDLTDPTKILCDGLDHVGWGSPQLHSNVRAGEEPLMEYTQRIITQAKSEILYPSFLPKMFMNWR